MRHNEKFCIKKRLIQAYKRQNNKKLRFNAFEIKIRLKLPPQRHKKFFINLQCAKNHIVAINFSRLIHEILFELFQQLRMLHEIRISK